MNSETPNLKLPHTVGQQKVNKLKVALTLILIAIPFCLIALYLFSFYHVAKPFDLGSGIKYATAEQSHGCPLLCDSSGDLTSYYYVTSGDSDDSISNQITTALRNYGFYYEPAGTYINNRSGDQMTVDITIDYSPNSYDSGPVDLQPYCPKNCSTIELDYFH
jgi:hypothetical protein